MPATISKIIDKAKPRFSFHHRHHSDGEEHHQHHGIFALSNSLPTHLFGYKDSKKDDYVEPPSSKLSTTMSMYHKHTILPFL